MVVDVDRVHQFPQNHFHRWHLALPEGKIEIATKSVDPVGVGDFVPTGLQLSKSVGELFKPGPTLGRRHGSVLEGGQISVNG